MEDILLKLFDYGIAGIAVYLLYKIANNKLTQIYVKLDKINENIIALGEKLEILEGKRQKR